MAKRVWCLSLLAGVIIAAPTLMSGAQHPALDRKFQTSDRCLACHNGIVTSSGQDVSIGLDWRSGMMANSSRDPYWQGSVRRESIDHPESRADIEDVCSTCHMPMSHYEAKWQGRKAEVFSFLPFEADPKKSASAEDGVSCSVCHQISREKLGTRDSFNGGFVIEAPTSPGTHPEYGPFAIQPGQQRIMQTSTGGFHPTEAAEHIRDSALCGTCHTLITETLGSGGKVVGSFPEQMPYLEWLHSDYPNKSTCQSCHMPEVHEAVPVTAVLGVPRTGVHLHVFVAANFFMQGMLNRYRQITSSDQVEIYEPILKDSAGRVTTGLLSAVGYLKDNRLLPSGFRKDTAEKDIAVVGEAADDPDFTDAGSLVRYSVALADAQGPFRVEAELWYQPAGFRWAHNLGTYDAPEPRRFVSYYDSMASSTAVVLARAEATR